MNRYIQITLLIFSILIFDNIKAQNLKVDSLERLLKIYKTEDTLKVNLLFEIAKEELKKDRNKSFEYSTQALELSNKIKFSKGRAKSLGLIGRYYVNTDNSLALDYFKQALNIADSLNYKDGVVKYLNGCGIAYKKQGYNLPAIECFQKALKISEESNNKYGIARCSQNISIIQSSNGNYEKSIEGYQKAIKIYEELDKQKAKSISLNNLGCVYEYQGNYTLALESYQKALKIKEELNDKYGSLRGYINISKFYVSKADYQSSLVLIKKALKIAEELEDWRNISSCLKDIGYIHQQNNNKSEALEYFQKALKIAEDFKNVSQVMSVSTAIGDFYIAHQDYQKAFEYYQKALKIAEEIKRKRFFCKLLHKIGNVYLNQKRYADALAYSKKSLTIANELKLLKQQKDIHNQLSEIYAITSNFKDAYKHHKIYKQLNDSIFNEKNIKKMAGLEFSNKFEKEKQAIELEHHKKDAITEAEIKHQRIIMISLIVAFIFMFSIAIFMYKAYRFKHRTNSLLTQQKFEIEKLNLEYLNVNKELKQSNEELYFTKNLVEKNEEKLRLLFKNSNDIFVLVNEKKEQFFISDVAYKLTGYQVEELTTAIENVIYPDDIEIVQQHWDRVLANKNLIATVQYRHKHKEKEYVWFEAVAQNFLEHPAINAIVANVRDITERKNTEEALRISQADKNKLLKLEKNRISEELSVNQKSLTASSLKIIQNSKRDVNTIKQLLDVKKNTNPEGKIIISKLISDYKLSSFNSNWIEFEILFEKVHHSFYEKINIQFPNLTANERKICAFLKLNMSSKDIMQITFQSEDALKKARLRLRQKLDICRETNLVAFLQNI
ncbi:MAG: tetratricopeptide repeat protein [Bacteroidales bacterium]|nr:tetratricopeptide repeat protein [Bacteroidales bacterium]